MLKHNLTVSYVRLHLYEVQMSPWNLLSRLSRIFTINYNFYVPEFRGRKTVQCTDSIEVIACMHEMYCVLQGHTEFYRGVHINRFTVFLNFWALNWETKTDFWLCDGNMIHVVLWISFNKILTSQCALMSQFELYPWFLYRNFGGHSVHQ